MGMADVSLKLALFFPQAASPFPLPPGFVTTQPSSWTPPGKACQSRSALKRRVSHWFSWFPLSHGLSGSCHYGSRLLILFPWSITAPLFTGHFNLPGLSHEPGVDPSLPSSPPRHHLRLFFFFDSKHSFSPSFSSCLAFLSFFSLPAPHDLNTCVFPSFPLRRSVDPVLPYLRATNLPNFLLYFFAFSRCKRAVFVMPVTECSSSPPFCQSSPCLTIHSAPPPPFEARRTCLHTFFLSHYFMPFPYFWHFKVFCPHSYGNLFLRAPL